MIINFSDIELPENTELRVIISSDKDNTLVQPGDLLLYLQEPSHKMFRLNGVKRLVSKEDLIALNYDITYVINEMIQEYKSAPTASRGGV